MYHSFLFTKLPAETFAAFLVALRYTGGNFYLQIIIPKETNVMKHLYLQLQRKLDIILLTP